MEAGRIGEVVLDLELELGLELDVKGGYMCKE